MRFMEAYNGWQKRRLTQSEAARIVGVHERTFRRYIDRYEQEGIEGLYDKRISQASHRRAPVDEVMRMYFNNPLHSSGSFPSSGDGILTYHRV